MQIENTNSSKKLPKVNISEETLKQTSSVQLSFGFNISTNQLISIFEDVSQYLNYEIIQKESNFATSIKQNKNKFFNLINCLNWVSDSGMTAIKITIHTNQKISKRICKIRGLVGSKIQLKHFIDLFVEKTNVLIDSKNITEESLIENHQQNQNPFHLQTCAAYMFNRILSNNQYGIGSTLSSSLKHFQGNYANKQLENSQSNIPMKFIMNLVNSTVQNLYQNFNYGRSQTQQIMPYCRISVQKYIFENVYKTLMYIYHTKSQKFSQKFIQKKQKIFKTKSLQQIFKQIHLKENIWNFIISLQNNDYRTIMKLSEWRQKIKIGKIFYQIQKIFLSKNPRQKIKHCQLMYTTMKTLFYEFFKGKQQLTNIEDILPLTILVILLSKNEKLKQQIDMLIDFSSFDSYDHHQSTPVLHHLNVCISLQQQSLNFITYQFKIDL